ncbi:Protein FANTASTIC FOUR like [Quillaja saponaria]|uniref:Protein FANTASTIC FOUR like n=1 Tax=Quillaja saponaria TaxID=32244 RepID=A0AAD7VEF9_QUISA|nr:Protein FANTASTIC FOUR like [Quillaja saponaria]
MSSPSVCKGLQSCLEPRLIEPCVLRFKLAPLEARFSQTSALVTKPCHPNSDPQEKSHATNQELGMKNPRTADMGGWSFLQSLTDNSNGTKTEVQTEKIYVHPLVKSHSSKLSTKCLEMCTESLGSETGNNVIDSSDDNALFSLESDNCTTRKPISKANKISVLNRFNCRSSFPPPLTSITELGGVQVRPHREDGRLVMKAETISFPCSHFHAERTNGRLQIRLLKDYTPECDNGVDDIDGIGEKQSEQVDEEDGFETENEEVYDEDCEDETEEVYRGDELEENSCNAEGEIGMEKFPRPSRCKEGGSGNNGLLNYEPFWVAT